MKMMLKFVVLAAFAVLPNMAVAQNVSAEQAKELALQAIRENPDVVLEIILENPDIVMQAVAILRARDEAAEQAAATAALATQGDDLFNDPNAIVLGNPDGDVTMVEFFDYNCGYCKRAYPVMQELLKSDDQLRVVFREWPILSDASVFAARAALAARRQGKYEEFHWAMMAGNAARSENGVLAAAAEVGLDLVQLKINMASPEVDAHIAKSRELAQKLGFNGTPSFVVGQNLVPGFVGKDAMLELIAEARAAN